jgi:hypothetical protein
MNESDRIPPEYRIGKEAGERRHNILIIVHHENLVYPEVEPQPAGSSISDKTYLFKPNREHAEQSLDTYLGAICLRTRAKLGELSYRGGISSIAMHDVPESVLGECVYYFVTIVEQLLASDQVTADKLPEHKPRSPKAREIMPKVKNFTVVFTP